MSVKIFCIGLSKTGTSTFGQCMHILGYKYCPGPHDLGLALHRMYGYGALRPFLKRNEAFGTFPWTEVYKEVKQEYPESKFVLTTRDTVTKWFNSVRNHVLSRGPQEGCRLAYGSFCPDEWEDKVVTKYYRHNAAVRDFFHGDSNFIELCWEQGHGWSELCAFLECPVPDVEFPHVKAAAALSPITVVQGLCEQGKFDSAVRYVENAPAQIREGLFSTIKKAIKDAPGYARYTT